MLVGLDWVEPMMFLSLHITCSCIFHAYVPSFIFILILICVGAFLRLSLSLSLSLPLSVSCSVAPKRKSVPSQNPLRSGASSFDSTSSHLQFRDEKACKNFLENFS